LLCCHLLLQPRGLLARSLELDRRLPVLASRLYILNANGHDVFSSSNNNINNYYSRNNNYYYNNNKNKNKCGDLQRTLTKSAMQRKKKRDLRILGKGLKKKANHLDE